MCGGNDQVTVQQPTPPTPQSAASSYADYVAMRPQMFEQDKLYSPQYAALEKQINEQLYPETASLQESLAKQANEGMASSMPDVVKQSMSDQLKATFGRNAVYNPLAQEQYGIGMANAEKSWGDYYRNMALSVANRQPLATSTVGTSSLTPAQVLSYNQGNYGTAANIYGTQANMFNNSQQLQAQYGNPWGNIAGSLAGGIGRVS